MKQGQQNKCRKVSTGGPIKTPAAKLRGACSPLIGVLRLGRVSVASLSEEVLPPLRLSCATPRPLDPQASGPQPQAAAACGWENRRQVTETPLQCPQCLLVKDIQQQSWEGSQKGRAHGQASIFTLRIFQAQVNTGPACQLPPGLSRDTWKGKGVTFWRRGQTEHGLLIPVHLEMLLKPGVKGSCLLYALCIQNRDPPGWKGQEKGAQQ